MQRKPLGFKSSVVNTEDYITIGDEYSGYIEDILKQGCFNYDEVMTWEAWVDRITDGDLKGEAWLTQQTEICVAMLKLRQDPEMTAESLRASVKDSYLIGLLYEFYVKERNRHAPSGQLLRVDGKGSKELAIAAAKERNGVAITRTDFANAGIYFVMASAKDVAEGFEVVADYSKPEEVKPLAVGKSKTKTA